MKTTHLRMRLARFVGGPSYSSCPFGEPADAFSVMNCGIDEWVDECNESKFQIAGISATRNNEAGRALLFPLPVPVEADIFRRKFHRYEEEGSPPRSQCPCRIG